MELVAKLSEPGYTLNLSSPVPSAGLVSLLMDLRFAYSKNALQV